MRGGTIGGRTATGAAQGADEGGTEDQAGRPTSEKWGQRASWFGAAGVTRSSRLPCET